MREKIELWIEAGMPHQEGLVLFTSIPNRRKNLDRTLSKDCVNSRRGILWHCCFSASAEDLYEKWKDSIGVEKEAVSSPKEIIEAEIQALISNAIHTDHKYKIPYAELPPDLQKKIILKGELYSRFDILKKGLNASRENEGGDISIRKEKLDEMHEVMDEIKAIDEELRKNENGQPESNQEEEKPTIINVSDLKLEKRNLQNNRSKLLKKVEGADSIIAEKARLKLEVADARLSEIEKMLNAV